MRLLLKRRNDAIDAIIFIRRFLRRTGNNQGRSGLINKNAVHLVDDGKIEIPLHIIRQIVFHIVAKIIKTKFIIRPVGHIMAISLGPFPIIEAMDNDTHLQSQKAIDLPHPGRITFCQIIIDGNDMDPLSRKRIEINRKCGHQGFTFPCFHLGNFSFMKDHTPNQLNIKMPHVENTLRNFPNTGEDLRKDFF